MPRKIDGQVVGNAMTPVRFTVTEQDIREGKPLNPNACAIALACVRQIKGVTAAKAHLGCIYLMRSGKWIRYRTSHQLAREVVAFDRGGKFWPGIYELIPPPIYDRSPHRARSSSSTKRRKNSYTEGVRDAARVNEGDTPPPRVIGTMSIAGRRRK